MAWSAERDTLRGFSFSTGEWSSLKIAKQESIRPLVGGTVAAIQMSNGVAAYSAETGTWDVLKVAAGPKAPISVGRKLVEVVHNGHLYNFAAAKGKWTSTDPAFNPEVRVIMIRKAEVDGVVASIRTLMPSDSIRISTTPGSQLVTVAASPEELNQVEELIRTLDNQTAPGSLSSGAANGTLFDQIQGEPPEATAAKNAYRLAEQKTLEIATAIRDSGTNDKSKHAELRDQVAALFDARQRIQEQQLKPLKAKLEQIEKTLTARKQNRTRIIDRRVEELIDPNLDWDTIAGNTSSRSNANTALGSSAVTSKAPSADSVVGSASGTALPATGTPLGLPGPPHLPLKSFAQRERPQLTSAQILESLQKKRQELYDTMKKVEKSKKEMAEFEAFLKDVEAESGSFNLVNSRLTSTRDFLASSDAQIRQLKAAWNHDWNQYQATLQSLRLDLQAAKIKLAKEESDLERKTSLSKRGLISSSDLDASRFAAELAQLEVQRATDQVALFESIQTEQKELNPSEFESSVETTTPVEN